MNPMNPSDPIDAWFVRLLPFDEAPTPCSRPVRICTRGKRGFQYVWMEGGYHVPGTLETTSEIDRLMREREAVRQS